MKKEMSDLMYELLHALRDSKAINTKQFNELFKLYKLADNQLPKHVGLEGFDKYGEMSEV